MEKPPYREAWLTYREQFVWGVLCGAKRWEEAKRKNLKDKHGMKDDEDTLEPHVYGVWGEMARAKAYNVWYVFTVNTFKSTPDVNGIEVRCRASHGFDLIVRKNDQDDRFFTLVTFSWARPDYFRVWDGGIYGYEAKKHDKWLKNYGQREPAYFVPKKFLLDAVVSFEIPRHLFTIESAPSARSGGL